MERKKERGHKVLLWNIFEEARAVLMLFVLLGAAWADIRWQKVPNRLLFAAFAGWAALGLLEGAARHWAGSILLVAMLLIPAWLRRGALGMGDVKLTGIMALYCGAWEAFLSFYYGLAAAAFISAALLAAKKKGRGGRLPFAPFLLVGYCVRLLARN